ncbi:tRNA(His) guanylyltransferase Thg1 family protein [Solirubrobacter sp. CPCC 204708]|uniref:tRNA(His) guanylyltransferase Thg1 family protein n=1 Tax=Solirubrobacter deserti TaxID=2282478 RepID=A0ABT4RJX3_9ACTN|nr:tRNA(His) guanylyltransferase Thg1 family protein [Solirubrobacter deserti]MBE2315823.1 tRNA(His) guanylyltransferase Thg1 family protein [Solirubrobacter deserti]MDA0138841.1 tRNA(His) guanylyltransferase Thg1 family protein [Solirubrobacter deserti]
MTLRDRMKAYEHEHRTALPSRTWTVVRLDGRAFSTWTAGLPLPYSTRLIGAMGRGMAELCRELAGAVIGFAQSDEISLVLSDFARPGTQAMFGGGVQKLVSVSASILTAHFARSFGDREPATFDARVFTLPDRDEVRNYLLWRQADGRNNARLMLGQRGGDVRTADPRFLHGQVCRREEAGWTVRPAPTLDCQPGTFLDSVIPSDPVVA